MMWWKKKQDLEACRLEMQFSSAIYWASGLEQIIELLHVFHLSFYKMEGVSNNTYFHVMVIK